MNEPTRAEHLKWCKERALTVLDSAFHRTEEDSCRSALMSIMSDLEKHPETSIHPGAELGLKLVLSGQPEGRDREAMRQFILGFH